MIGNRLTRHRRVVVASLLCVMVMFAGGCASPLKSLARLPVRMSAEVRKHSPLPLAMSLAAAEGVAEKVLIPGLP